MLAILGLPLLLFADVAPPVVAEPRRGELVQLLSDDEAEDRAGEGHVEPICCRVGFKDLANTKQALLLIIFIPKMHRYSITNITRVTNKSNSNLRTYLVSVSSKCF